MHGTFGRSRRPQQPVRGRPRLAAGYADACPSGNVDVAPTVASPRPEAAAGRRAHSQGSLARPDRQLHGHARDNSRKSRCTLSKVCNPDDIACATPASETSYSMTLTTKVLHMDNNATETYFDQAKATRQ